MMGRIGKVLLVLASLAGAIAPAAGQCTNIDPFVKTCPCPLDCKQSRCETTCYPQGGSRGRCVVRCNACSCDLIGRKDESCVPFSGVLRLIAGTASADTPGEKSVSNEDGDFLILDQSRVKQLAAEHEQGLVGLHVVSSGTSVQVGSAMENGPAARAGVESGDEVVSIDARKCQGMPLEMATKALRGKPGTLVVLKIRSKKSGKVRKVSLIRETLGAFSKEAREPSVGLKEIPIKSFGESCPADYQGCHFLYEDKGDCIFTCPKKN